jgi:group I intron endonuclease
MDYSCGIYKIENVVNKKMYIGGSKNLHRRKSEHFSKLKYDKNGNYFLQKEYNEHGKDSFIFSVLIYCEPHEINRYEQEVVNYFSKSYLLYNICLENVNNNTGVVSRDETRKKISESHADMKKEKHPMWGREHTEETKKKISLANSGENSWMWNKRGENNPNYGKKLSEETKLKISLSGIGRVPSEETRKNISSKKQGKKRTNKKYIGIRRRKNRWESRITCQGVSYQIGSFLTEIEAAIAYNQKAIELYGESARLNIIED